jgi:hypothetical protein
MLCEMPPFSVPKRFHTTKKTVFTFCKKNYFKWCDLAGSPRIAKKLQSAGITVLLILSKYKITTNWQRTTSPHGTNSITFRPLTETTDSAQLSFPRPA